MSAYATPGVSIGIVDRSEMVWEGGFGVGLAGSSTAVAADTLFQAGSVSKPVFATAVMRLVERGLLDLDENVNTYLTSWRIPSNGGWSPGSLCVSS
ncbi:CubicO group peptidase (beta-lactamase class C family) [Inquilinus ginsengisoli]|uniref:serine hydrolase domain-containing protein n=1 Tax=Inquilinus ginsengisoli TaxID=363840 RepID=UPI003D1A0FB9